MDFYKKVATPETQYQQSAAPSGPTVDANARAEAQNEAQNSLGSAIMDLAGTASTLVAVKQDYDKAELARMKSEHQLDVDTDLADIGSYMRTFIDQKNDGKGINDYEPEELRGLVDEATGSFIKSKNLSDKGYFKLIQEEVKQKSGIFFNKQTQANQKVKQDKRYGALMGSVKSLFDVSSDPETVVAQLRDKIDQNVGLGPKTVMVDGQEVEVNPSIKDSEENAKVRMVQPILQAIMEKRDPRALKMLESKEFKEFFDFPDYDNVINAAKQQVQSTINRNRQVSYDQIEEAGYFAMESGLFTTSGDVDTFFEEQLATIPEERRPESKRLMKLKSDFKESFDSELLFQNAYHSIKGGDYTVLERSDLKKKQIEAMKNKFFSVETGIDDLSPRGISDAVKSGQYDAQLKNYFSEGFPLPPHLEKWANTPPSNGIQGIRDKHETFLQLNTLTQDTSKSTLDLFKPKEYSRMMFAGNLIDNIDSGVMDEKEALQVYSTFNNDLKKNVDSFGTYTSPKAAAALQDDEVKEWLQEMKTDAPWTYDEFSSQAYMERQFTNYFSYAMETTDDIDKAKETAERMFYARHTAFENPDGSEGVMPHEFKSFDVKKFVEVAEELPEFQEIKEVAGYLGILKDYDFKSNLSFRPDPSYEKNKLMNFYYDGKFIVSMSSDMMRKNLNVLGKRKVKDAEKRNIQTTQAIK